MFDHKFNLNLAQMLSFIFISMRHGQLKASMNLNKQIITNYIRQYFSDSM